MTIAEMRERKKEMGYSYAQISEMSGVPVGTVQKVLGGSTESPRYDTLQALEQALGDHSPSRVEEASFWQVKVQGEYTLEDYYQLPDDQRVELIDGRFFYMEAPTSIHQILTGTLYAKLYLHITTNKDPCTALVSPVDVQLDQDDKTMVEPDVVVVCDRDKIIRRCIYGAPDFVIEILSPSTRRKDMQIKLNKYQMAGVREYWIVDPDKLKIIVYDLEHDDYAIYGFDSVVPVTIWNGDCQIDFREIYEEIRFLQEREEG